MKGVLKVSKEQVIEIERYCDEHGITRKQRISELGLSHSCKRTIDYSGLDVVENVIDSSGSAGSAVGETSSPASALMSARRNGYCHNHDAAYRAAIIYSFIATCDKADVNPREWMVHHTTEAEHVAVILKSRAKRKASEEGASKEESKQSPDFAELHKTWQTLPNCAKLHRNPTETDMCMAGRFHKTTFSRKGYFAICLQSGSNCFETQVSDAYNQ